jgi:hypothetical protein
MDSARDAVIGALAARAANYAIDLLELVAWANSGIVIYFRNI